MPYMLYMVNKAAVPSACFSHHEEPEGKICENLCKLWTNRFLASWRLCAFAW